jgi:phosphoenolpyruvate carboxylase
VNNTEKMLSRLSKKSRAIAKSRRGDDAEATARLVDLIRNIDLDAKNVLIKAFGNYFQLINIAEDQTTRACFTQTRARKPSA